MVYIVDVEISVIMHGSVTATRNLPPAGQPGSNGVTRVLPRSVRRDDFGQFGPGADEAHIAANHVPELGQLVDASAAEELTWPGDPWIVWNLVAPAPVLVSEPDKLRGGRRGHGPQLQQRETAATATNSLLQKQGVGASVEGDPG